MTKLGQIFLYQTPVQPETCTSSTWRKNILATEGPILLSVDQIFGRVTKKQGTFCFQDQNLIIIEVKKYMY